MTTERDTPTESVGYGKTPLHSRYRKGQSGNPGGRPRGYTPGRAVRLALQELFRPLQIREGEKIRRMPALQAVLRSQVQIAAKGNTAAQRSLLELALAVEKLAAAPAAGNRAPAARTVSDIEAARRIAAALQKLAPKQTPEK